MEDRVTLLAFWCIVCMYGPSIDRVGFWGELLAMGWVGWIGWIDWIDWFGDVSLGVLCVCVNTG